MFEGVGKTARAHMTNRREAARMAANRAFCKRSDLVGPVARGSGAAKILSQRLRHEF
jgi:hypothetical protein